MGKQNAKDLRNRMTSAMNNKAAGLASGITGTDKSVATVPRVSATSSQTNGMCVADDGTIYKPKEYIVLGTKQIVVSKVYQRSIDKARVEKIVNEYKTELYTAIKIYKRQDGSYYLVDGQHRLMAHMAKFGENSRIQCEVIERISKEFKYMTDSQFEAWIFEHQYDNASKLGKQALIRAAIEAKEDFAMDVVEILESNGFEINLNTCTSANNKPACVATIFRIYEGPYGEKILRELMKICRDAFDGDKESFKKDFLEYMTVFLKKYIDDANYNHDECVRKLKAKGINEIISDINALRLPSTANNKIAKTMRDEAIACTIRDIYNNRRKTNRLE